jgi:hypothetical protein
MKTPPHRSLYQGRGWEPDEARKIALEYFEKHKGKPLLIGPVSLEIGHNYGLNETEKLLDQLVSEGVLRLATHEELGSKRLKGYVFPIPPAPPSKPVY